MKFWFLLNLYEFYILIKYQPGAVMVKNDNLDIVGYRYYKAKRL